MGPEEITPSGQIDNFIETLADWRGRGIARFVKNGLESHSRASGRMEVGRSGPAVQG